MKAILVFSLLVFGFVTNSLQSQIFYAKISGAYGLGTNTSLLSTSTGSGNTEGHYGSYGEGIMPTLGLGYLFNSNVGVELNGSYLIGKKFEHTHTTAGLTETHKEWGEGILLSPSLLIQTHFTSVIPYARFGAMLGFVKVKEETTESGTGARTGTYKVEHSGKIAAGFNGAFGLRFRAGNRLYIFTEIFANSITYAPEKRENTETYSGGTLDPTVTYKEEYASSTANTSLTPRFPFSSFGLNVGLSLTLGSVKKTKK